MGASFIPFCAIIAVLIIAFLFASLPQVSHKTRYRVLYAIAIIMLFAVIPISEYMAWNTKKIKQQFSACSDIRYCSRLFLYLHKRSSSLSGSPVKKCRISQRTRRKAGLVSKVYPSVSARHRP